MVAGTAENLNSHVGGREGTYQEWHKSFKTSKFTHVTYYLQKATPPGPSQTAPPIEVEAFKHVSL